MRFHPRIVGLALAVLVSLSAWALAATLVFAITPAEMRLIESVNATVNRQIAYVRDPDGGQWTGNPINNRGDCEDIALTKLTRLMMVGISGARMNLVLVKTEVGEDHVVLVVDNDIVLDNRFARVRRRADLIRAGYRFL